MTSRGAFRMRVAQQQRAMPFLRRRRPTFAFATPRRGAPCAASSRASRAQCRSASAATPPRRESG
jgi:hypothetical protein